MQNQITTGVVPETEPVAIAVTPETAPVTRSDQDSAQIQDIMTAQATLAAVRQDAALTALLASHGYTAEILDAGAALAMTAETAFRERQYALAARLTAMQEFVARNETAREQYAEFRLLARGVFNTPAARTEMGLHGSVPADFQLFTARVRLGYATALATPAYRDALATHGMTAEMLQSNLAQMDALVAAANAAAAARADAARTTRARDTATRELNRWMSRFRLVMRYATRHQPEMVARIGY